MPPAILDERRVLFLFLLWDKRGRRKAGPFGAASPSFVAVVLLQYIFPHSIIAPPLPHILGVQYLNFKYASQSLSKLCWTRFILITWQALGMCLKYPT